MSASESEANREDEAGETTPVDKSRCYDPRETLETFLGDSLHKPPRCDEEMAELRELAKTNPGIAAALRLAARGGLDVQVILDVRNAEFEDFELSGDDQSVR